MTHGFRQRPPPPPTPEIDPEVWGILRVFALAAVVLMYYPIDMWRGTITETEVPIGTVKSVSAASGGLHGLTVLETETGFYALRGHATIHKGAALILDTRINGDQYVCDAGKKVCVRTSRRHLSGTGGGRT